MVVWTVLPGIFGDVSQLKQMYNNKKAGQGYLGPSVIGGKSKKTKRSVNRKKTRKNRYRAL